MVQLKLSSAAITRMRREGVEDTDIQVPAGQQEVCQPPTVRKPVKTSSPGSLAASTAAPDPRDGGNP